MRRSRIPLLSVLAALAICLAASAANPAFPSDRYSGIPERNVFGLQPPTAEPEPIATNSPPPKLFLTGITTVLTNKLALMRVAVPATPGKPAEEKPIMLAEGQREGGIEVLRINEKTGSVEVNDFGTVQTLDFAKNGIKPPSSSGTGAVAVAQARLTNWNPALARTWPGRGMRVLPTRTPRVPASGGGGGVGLEGNLTAPAESGGAPTTLPPAAVPAPTVPTNTLTPNEQAFLNQLEQEMAQTNSIAQPPPPAPLPGRPVQLPQGANTQRSHAPLMPQ